METPQKHGLSMVLSHLMQECDIDDASLSRQIDIPASSISRMRLVPDANPTAATLRPIAKFFDVSIDQLLGDEPLPEHRLPGTHNPSSFAISVLPVIEWGWIENWIEKKKFPRSSHSVSWITSEHALNEKAFALVVPNEMFGLFLRKGSIILIDPAKQPQDGDIVILKEKENNTIILRQVFFEGKQIYIRSINPELKSTEILSVNHKIIGAIVETRFLLQEEREYSKKMSLTEVSLLVQPKIRFMTN